MVSLHHQMPSHILVLFPKSDCQMLMDSAHDPVLSGLSIFPTWKEEEDYDNVSIKTPPKKIDLPSSDMLFQPGQVQPDTSLLIVIKLCQSIPHRDRGPLAKLLVFVGRASALRIAGCPLVLSLWRGLSWWYGIVIFLSLATFLLSFAVGWGVRTHWLPCHLKSKRYTQ